MTSHGYGGLSRIFYGGVAAGILNRVDRPLFRENGYLFANNEHILTKLAGGKQNGQS
jgi:hypothetical protein